MAKKFYAVLHGRQPGVYDSWSAAEAQVRGFRKAKHRSFPTHAEAEDWLTHLQAQDTTASQQQQQQHTSQPPAPPRSPSPPPASSHSAVASSRPSASFSITGGSADSYCSRGAKPAESKIFSLYCDGASRNNPGPSGYGGALFSPQLQALLEYKHYLGPRSTNNESEYAALLRGLALAQLLRIDCLRVKCDSMFVVQQSAGAWKVSAEHLRPYQQQVQGLLASFTWWELQHIPREQNSNADRLSNEAIDERSDNVVLFRNAQLDEQVKQRVMQAMRRGSGGARLHPKPSASSLSSTASSSSSSSSASSHADDSEEEEDTDESLQPGRPAKRTRYVH